MGIFAFSLGIAHSIHMNRQYSAIITIVVVAIVTSLLYFSKKSDSQTISEATQLNQETPSEDASLAQEEAQDINNPEEPLEREAFLFDPFSFQKKFGSKWQITDNGVFQKFSGGLIEIPELSNAAIIKVAKDMAPLFGVSEDQINNVFEMGEFENGTHFLVTQDFDGYDIHGGQLKLIAQKDSKKIIEVENHLIPNITTPDLNAVFGVNDVKKRLKKRIPAQESLGFPATLIFIKGLAHGELAYRFMVPNENGDKEILYSAKTGELLSE